MNADELRSRVRRAIADHGRRRRKGRDARPAPIDRRCGRGLHGRVPRDLLGLDEPPRRNAGTRKRRRR